MSWPPFRSITSCSGGDEERMTSPPKSGGASSIDEENNGMQDEFAKRELLERDHRIDPRKVYFTSAGRL